MRKIKKYANRKLYDTTDKQYISLERLSTLIKDGEAVEIIDNTTGEDITSSVVSQLLAREPRDKEEVPSSVLFDLLRKGGGTLSDYAKKYASLWKSAMTMAEDEVDKVVRALVRDKEISADEGSLLRKEISGYLDSSRKWVGDQVDHRIKDILGAMNLASKDQIEKLSEKIEKLSEKIEILEKQRSGGKESPPSEGGR